MIPLEDLTPEEQARITRMNTIGKAIEDSVKNKDILPEDVAALAVSLISAFARMNQVSFLVALGLILGYSDNCFPVDMGDQS